jgi:hypothetical protein
MSALLTLPYKLARFPLSVVDSTVADRLPETSAPRLVLDKVLGSADRFAGSVLGDHALAARGSKRLERTQQVQESVSLSQQAADARREARETVEAGQEEAQRKREAAQDRAASGLEEADRVEADGMQKDETEAEAAEATKKEVAAKRAAGRKAAAERRRKAEAEKADAVVSATQAKTAAVVADADEAQESADKARSDADRLDQLVDAKKSERTQD